MWIGRYWVRVRHIDSCPVLFSERHKVRCFTLWLGFGWRITVRY